MSAEQEAGQAAAGSMDVDVESSKKGTMDIDAGGNGKKAPRFQVKKVFDLSDASATITFEELTLPTSQQWNSVCLWSWDIVVDNVSCCDGLVPRRRRMLC
ncbi:hypothetical protein L7F22_016380 [Adiantum nelumboides]|nr:hypothetical protein [Adiantum nelumboides]